MQLAIIFINIGAYHAARIRALGDRIKPWGWSLHSIQLTDDLFEHHWGNWWDALSDPVTTLLPSNQPGFRSEAIFGHAVARQLRQTLDQMQPDVVLIPGWALPAARAALFWCRQNRAIALLMSESKADDAPRVWWRERYKRWFISRCRGAIVGGQKHRAYLLKLGMQPEQIQLGYDVVDNQLFAAGVQQDWPRPIAQPYFLSVSRFVPKKNLPFLLTAYAEYIQASQGEPWHLILCGSGPLQPVLVEQIQTLGLGDRVHLPGFLTTTALLPYLAHAQCLIHASLQEQWGLVVNEAMAAGLPVLVSERCGCVPELLIAGKTGFSFDPTQPQTLVELMLKLQTKADRLQAMGQFAQQHIQANFSPDHFAAAIVQLIRPQRPA